MGAYVFDNQVFDSWLNRKSEEILKKVDQEKITTEEMIILVLKAQTNHFFHVDIETKEKFHFQNRKLEDLDQKFELRFEQVDKRFEQIDKRFEQIDKRFEQIDKRFERLERFMMWQTGLTAALISGLYFKSFI